MWILETFTEHTFIDNAFAFDELELEQEKRRMINQAQKGDTIYISTMNNVYDRDVIINTITKLT